MSHRSHCNGVPFADFCMLLDKLEKIHDRTDAIALPKDRELRTQKALSKWFQTHKNRINTYHTADTSVLMLLKPEYQADRDYGFAEDFEQHLTTIFKLSSRQSQHLKRWREEPDYGDLGSRLCRILKAKGHDPLRSCEIQPSVRGTDQKLLRLAIFNDGSSEAVKSLACQVEGVPSKISLLADLYLDLLPMEAKWVTRMIQKSYGVTKIPDEFEFLGEKSSLPDCLRVRIIASSEERILTRKHDVRARIQLPISPQDPLLWDSKTHVGANSEKPTVQLDGQRAAGRSTQASAEVENSRKRKRMSHEVDLKKSAACLLPTPPTSSPSTPHERSPTIGTRHGPRFRIGLDPASSKLAQPVRIHTPPTPANSSPLLYSSSNHSAAISASSKPTAAAKTNAPPTPVRSSPLPSASPTRSGRENRRSPVAKLGYSSTESSQGINHQELPPRSALSQISSNRSPGGSQKSQSKSTTKATEAGSPPKVITLHPARSPITFSTGKCTLVSRIPKHRCRFANTLIILSPCISTFPYILENLILPHGAHYITSLSQLSHPSVPRRSKSGRRLKKYILVEINRPAQTVDFCKRAERKLRALGWKCDKGLDERIPIFDWRVLEDFASLDKGEQLGHDPVGKHFQGTV
ncbi:hypothetical protein LZ554_008691 [Drepanopeziza brunnea f. sp. 'monogermtubi']|nr:hypothetical protein LZ554_008691 [Drepanopeziza brunnea f. sp. 'monogermtubi']